MKERYDDCRIICCMECPGTVGNAVRNCFSKIHKRIRGLHNYFGDLVYLPICYYQYFEIRGFTCYDVVTEIKRKLKG